MASDFFFMVPKSRNILEVLLHAEKFMEIYCFLTSMTVELLVPKEKNAFAGAVCISLSAEGIERFKLVSGSQDTEHVKDGEHILLKKDLNGIQEG